MEFPETGHPLTPELIRRLLEDDMRAEMPASYVRLMEIYCVVRAGGAAAQIQATRYLEQTEKALLLKSIEDLSSQSGAEGQIRSLQNEIQELERSMAMRVHHLRNIDLQEEANVRSCLSEIDGYFQRLGKASQ